MVVVRLVEPLESPGLVPEGDVDEGGVPWRDVTLLRHGLQLGEHLPRIVSLAVYGIGVSEYGEGGWIAGGKTQRFRGFRNRFEVSPHLSADHGEEPFRCVEVV